MERFRLLAVDDTPDNLFLLEQVLGAYMPECEIVAARSAREGLELAARRALDGALIDVQLPEIDGIEMCRRLKAQDPSRRLPVLLITAKGSTVKLRTEALEAGADDFLSRPIDNAELVAKIRVMLRIRQAERTLSTARDELEVRVGQRTSELELANAQLRQEIAERRRAEERLAHSEFELAVRNRIAEAFLTLGGDEVFPEVLGIVLEVLASRYGIFGYIDEQGALACPSMTTEIFEKCRMENKTAVFPPETWGQSIWGRAIREKQLLCANTPLNVPEGHMPITRAVSSPIVYQDKTIGIINVANKDSDYESADLEVLRSICMYIAPVLHARLHRDRHERQRQQAEAALLQAHHELEDRVRQRTAELVTTNEQLQTQIAERRRAEEALRETNSLLERVFSTTQVLLAYMDTDFRFIRVNRAYAEYDRHPAEWFVGKHHFELYPNDENEAVFRKVIRDGLAVSFQAKPFTYADRPERGVTYWDWSLHPVKNTDNAVEGLLLCLVDVTSRELAEQQSRQHQAQLAHVSRLSTMGEMGTAMAHELNQPLCAILVSAQASRRLLKAAGVEDGSIRGAIDQIVGQAKRAGDIIRHLREFTRRRPTQRTRMSMPELIRETMRFVSAETRPHRVQIDLRLAEPVPMVLGDAIQIEQVLVNLVRNAIEAMDGVPENQRVVRIELSMPQPDRMDIAIRDRGKGLPEGPPDQVFEPFFSTKPEGMGVGLSISRSIIELHDGRLWAERAEGGGTVFRFTLPVANGQAPEGHEVATGTGLPDASRGKGGGRRGDGLDDGSDNGSDEAHAPDGYGQD